MLWREHNGATTNGQQYGDVKPDNQHRTAQVVRHPILTHYQRSVFRFNMDFLEYIQIVEAQLKLPSFDEFHFADRKDGGNTARVETVMLFEGHSVNKAYKF